MRITDHERYSLEISLKDFHFWDGAAARRQLLTDRELDIIESCLPELLSESDDEDFPGVDETELNDFLWFEDDIYCAWIGLEPYELYDREQW